jgi:hypothetical protein
MDAPLFEFLAPPGSPDASENSYLLTSAHDVSSSSIRLLRGEGFSEKGARLQRISDDGLGCSVAKASDLPELFGPS